MTRNSIDEPSPESLLRPELLALSAYPVADAGDLIKLDAMESPFAWPGDLLESWLDSLRQVQLNRYPSAGGDRLKQRLRQTFEVSAAADLLLGNGSDELIQLVALALAAPGRVVMAPDPSFVVYRMAALFAGMEYLGIPLNDGDFSLDSEAMAQAIEEHRPGLIFLAYPNNPTGNRFEADQVARIIEQAPGLVVVDEAYYAYSNDSFLPRVLEHPNVVVMRTVSKIGLAGLRLGFLAGAKRWIEALDKLRLPYNINTLTQVSADFALQHHELLMAQAQQIREQRPRLAADLAALPGLRVNASETNFLLVRTPQGRASDLHEALRAGGILVKNMSSAGGSLTDSLRITVSTAEINQKVVSLLQKAL